MIRMRRGSLGSSRRRARVHRCRRHRHRHLRRRPVGDRRERIVVVLRLVVVRGNRPDRLHRLHARRARPLPRRRRRRRVVLEFLGRRSLEVVLRAEQARMAGALLRGGRGPRDPDLELERGGRSGSRSRGWGGRRHRSPVCAGRREVARRRARGAERMRMRMRGVVVPCRQGVVLVLRDGGEAGSQRGGPGNAI